MTLNGQVQHDEIVLLHLPYSDHLQQIEIMSHN